MTHIAIRIEQLGKRYQIGAFQRSYNRNIRDVVTETALAPLRRMKAVLRNHTMLTASETIWALKDLSLEVKRGEVIGVIGSNGAGKSTLLKILSRITRPTEGYCEIHGRVGSLLEVGTGFNAELTGRENIYLSGAILGMKKHEIDHRFNEIVEFSGIEQFIDTPVKRYSSGMYMRLAFSVAAHLESNIMLIDEVLAVGDVAFQKKCLGKMGDIADSGRTVLFVSHNMEPIIGLCSRAIWLKAGQKEAEGPAEEIVRRYLTDSRKFIESQASLAERTDRTGNGEMRFTGCRLRNCHDDYINAVATGEAVDFVLTYVGSTESISNVTVWLWIRDSLGRILLTLWSRLTGEDFATLPREGELICHVPRFPLIPGTYLVDIHASVNGIRADRISNAIELEVVPGDFFGTGRSPQSSDGVYLCDHSWHLEK